MINAYGSNGSPSVLTAVQPVGSLSEDIVWIDLFEPTREEDSYVEQLLDISVPTRDELKDIEPSSRLYTEKNGLFMTGSVVWKADSEEPELTDVAFILAGGRLLTVRYAEPRSFRLFTAALGRTAQAHHTGASLLAHLIETIVDRTAEILEGAVTRVDRLSIDIFRDREKRRPPKFLEGKLADIAGCHRLVGKVRDSLGSLSRVLSFLMNAPAIAAESELHSLCGTVARDVATLSEHAAFVAGNIAFLLDASLGLINVEQNAIIKIFSIASVVFLPPTLVASVYGMNFRMMPELDWTFGYPWALLAMLVSALVPFYFFRWKGWL